MQFRNLPESVRRFAGSRGFHSGPAVAALVAIFALTAAAQSRPRALQQHDSDPQYVSSNANRVPDANDRMMLQEQQQQKQNFEDANAARRKLLADESALLLQLATQLKSEMDKTDKDTLSLGVIRKAEQIEKLAKDVKAHMKLTVGQG